MAEYIKKDELLKFKADVYDEDGHVLYAVPTGYIVSMPPADVMQVRHGRWIMVDDSCGKYACSACREIEQECTEWGAGHYNPVDKDYCPNCGAKMDGWDEFDENRKSDRDT